MKEDKLMAHDPLSDADAILSEEYYGRRARTEDPAPGSGVRRRAASGPGKPTHYKVICISMYTKDLARLDELVEELKTRGITKANRSALIRVALEQLDLDKVPRGL